METQWYYARDGKQLGPVSAEALHRLAREGQLNGDNLVWRAGMEKWEKAAAVGIGGEIEPPPVAPVSSPPPPPVAHPAAPQTATQRPTRRKRSSFDPQLIIWGGSGLFAFLICVVFIVSSGRKSQVADRRNSRRTTSTAPIRTRSPSPRTVAGARGGNGERPGVAPRVEQPLAQTRSASGSERNITAPSSIPPSTPSRLPLPNARTEMPKLLEDLVAATQTKPEESPEADNATSRSSTGETELTDSPKPAAQVINSSNATNSKLAEQQQTLFQKIDIQRQPKFSVQGLTTTQNIHYQLFSKLTIDSTKDGTRTVTQFVEETRLLAADDLSRATFAKSLDELKRRQFTYKLDSHGEVVDFTGYKKNLASLPVDLLSGSGFMMTSVIDEDGWKELAELTFFVPKLDAQQGEPWQRQMAHDFGQLGSWSGATTFTWGKSNQDDSATERINYRHDMTHQKPTGGESKLPFKIKAASFTLRQASGSIAYDRAKQRVSTVEEIFDVSGSVTIELAGQSLPVELTERQQITIELSEQKQA
ncbi:MAG: hypothetical protein CMJ64_25845 [Planctomycetaceae bacterium]|nr:hypothetical protein [Planctomycetaceae bacterium]